MIEFKSGAHNFILSKAKKLQNYEHPDNLQTCKNTSIRLLQDTQLNCVFLSKIFNNLDCSRSVCLLHCVINTQIQKKLRNLDETLH